MPAGKHAGTRTLITLPKEVDEAYTVLAASLGMHKASLFRELLTSSLPMVQQTTDVVNKVKEDPNSIDDVFARLLWDALKGLPK